MHEAVVAGRILRAAQGYGAVNAVVVSVGRKSCVHPDMLRNAFNMAKRGTPLEGAELVALHAPGDDISVLWVETDDDGAH